MSSSLIRAPSRFEQYQSKGEARNAKSNNQSTTTQPTTNDTSKESVEFMKSYVRDPSKFDTYQQKKRAYVREPASFDNYQSKAANQQPTTSSESEQKTQEVKKKKHDT